MIGHIQRLMKYVRVLNKIELIGQIQKQKLNTVTNITNGINKTLDKFIDINEQHLIFHFQ